MRRCLLVVTLLAAAACGGNTAARADSATAPAAVAAAPANTKAEEDSIRVMIVRIGTVMSTRDTAAVTALYTVDGVDFTPGMSPAEGRAALAKEYADIFRTSKDLKFSVIPGDVTVAQSGDLAIARASYELTATDAQGKSGTERGNVILGWKKVNGQWKIALSMNAPTAPASGT